MSRFKPAAEGGCCTPAAEDADAREFDAYVQAQDPLDVAAATWVTRRRSGLDAEGEAQLQAWLDADPRHAAAFVDIGAILGELQRLPADDVAALKAGLAEHPRAAHDATPPTHCPPARRATPPGAVPIPPFPASGNRPQAPAVRGRRQWLLGLVRLLPQASAAAFAVAVVGGSLVGWEHWRQLPTYDQTYATERGQQLSVTLPDHPARAGAGSTLYLDTATQVHARLYRDRREMRLTDGQALFAVHADATRPFHVHAGALRITVLGTRFSVRHAATGVDAGQTVVTVEEGRVRVVAVQGQADAAGPGDPGGPALVATAEPAAGRTVVELTAGQRVSADRHGRLGPVTALPAAAIAPWREGRISFDRTPLAQAIAEFERYGSTGLVVRDPAVAALLVGGSYSLQQLQHFADSLPKVLPVRLVRRGDVTEVVSK